MRSYIYISLGYLREPVVECFDQVMLRFMSNMNSIIALSQNAGFLFFYPKYPVHFSKGNNIHISDGTEPLVHVYFYTFLIYFSVYHAAYDDLCGSCDLDMEM